MVSAVKDFVAFLVTGVILAIIFRFGVFVLAVLFGLFGLPSPSSGFLRVAGYVLFAVAFAIAAYLVYFQKKK